MAKDGRVRPKQEALAALTTARGMLDAPEPMTGVRKVQLRGLIEYAQEQVGAIQELKKQRREAAAPVQEALHE